MKEMAENGRLGRWNLLDKLTILVAMSVLILLIATTVQADLRRVGPVDPTNGFPVWYQDHSRVAVDFCLPNATELQNGTCFLFPADIPDPTQPISFPSNFPEEAFWWNATATGDVNGGKALLLIALEGAFFNGPVVPGDQVAFARLRIRIDTPNGGTFRVIHPFGEKTFDVPTGGRRAINFTADVGVVPGNFALALEGPIGPFLLASSTPGGPPLPFVILPGGNTYLADPNIATPVTGSPFNTNYFRIEGPNIGGPGIDFVEIDEFALLGRVHLGPIVDPLNVERATYTRDMGEAWVDVFVSVDPAIVPPPILSFTGTGIPGKIMLGDGPKFYGQSIAADQNVLPPSIKVWNNSDNPASTTDVPLTDLVTVTEASFSAGTLTIRATSSDTLVPPTLVVQDFGSMTTGVLVVNGLTLPPAEVKVISSAGGSNTMAVVTKTEPVVGPVVVDDLAVTDADQPVIVDVLANDPASGVTLRVLGNPAHGTVSLVSCPAPSTSPICIQYAPTLYYFGTDQFTYVVKDSLNNDSNVGTVEITINFVNHNPVANDDAATVAKNASVVIDVLANDVDPDGNETLDPSTVTIIDPPTAGLATVDPATGKITYNAPDVEGIVTFTYRVSDMSIPVLESNTATVTVTVFQVDIIDTTKALFKIPKSQWTIVGTTLLPGPGNIVTVHLGPTLAGPIIGTTAPDAVGAWKLVVKNSTLPPDATETVSIESSLGGQQLAYPVRIKN